MSDSLRPPQLVEGDEAFLDTSVVLNRIHREVEGNKGSAEIYDCDKVEKTLGSTVINELEDRIEVRKVVYRDLATFVNKSSNDGGDIHIVFKYEVYSRDATQELDLTDNDITHIYNLQSHIAEDCDKPAYTLRKYNRLIKKRVGNQVSNHGGFSNSGDQDLAEKIGGRIDNYSDGEVLAQAVKWRHIRENNENCSVETVVSADSDMYGNEDEINEEIERKHSRFSTLSIVALTEFLDTDCECNN